MIHSPRATTSGQQFRPSLTVLVSVYASRWFTKVIWCVRTNWTRSPIRTLTEVTSLPPQKEVAELDEQSAQRLASEKAVADGIEPLATDKWTVHQCNDGWLVSLRAPDPLAGTGSHHFVVLGSGSIFRESGSMPPFGSVAKHSTAGRGLILAADGGHLAFDEQGGVRFETRKRRWIYRRSHVVAVAPRCPTLLANRRLDDPRCSCSPG
jgi:hypothetical protein